MDSWKALVKYVAVTIGLAMGVCPGAQAALTATPITWNIIGLDSNSPAAGPRNFPVGAHICSNVATTNVAVAFVWDSANANINLRPGSQSSLVIPSIAAGTCQDAYFEAEVTQTAAAYGTTRRYHITATDGSGTASTPLPRELFVERLISQNRNAITNVRYGPTPASLTAVPAGGALNLVVGNTYTIELSGGTATQGYEQFEAFINFSNTIFQILSVSTTYSANTSIYVTSPSDKLYADACLWQNDPNSPNYRSCAGVTGKTGGANVVTTYTVRILGGGGTAQTLNTLLYDFSGSSFHYNADYAVGARIANIIDPGAATIAKSFSPNPSSLNGVAALSFTLGNPNAAPVGGYSVVDNLPVGLVVRSPSGVTTAGCGAPTVTAPPGGSTITIADAAVAANSSCVIKVDVTPTTTGTLVNTTNPLFVGGVDTGKTATATLTVNSAPPPGTGLCGLTLASWNFPTGMSTTAPLPTVSNVTAAAAAGAGVVPVFSSGDNTITPAGTGSWGSNGAVAVGTPLATTNNDYFEFALNTTGISAVYLRFDALFKTPNGPRGLAVYYGTTNTRPETGTSVFNNATALSTQNVWSAFGAGNSIAFTSGLNAGGNTYFRIYGFNSGNTNSGSDINLDNVLFTGCGSPVQPTLAKAFVPAAVAVNGVSTLTFTLANTNAAALSGAAFADTLPAGVQVAAVPAAATTCGGTWAPAAGATTLNFSGGVIPAGSSCTVSVNTAVTTAGPKTNVGGFLSTTEGGTNTGSVPVASVTGVLPPAIAKQFAPNPILAGGSAILTFTITNPNQNAALAGIAFSDTYPANLVNAATPGVVNGCGGSFTAAAGGSGFSLSGGTLAGGASCTVSVAVTSNTPGNYANVSGNVSHLINAQTVNGNTASATLGVTPPHPSIGLLKQIGPAAAGPWADYIAVTTGAPVYYRFTVENTGDVPLTPVSLADGRLNVSACNTAFTGLTLPVAVAANDNHIVTCVVGPVAATTGEHTNVARASGSYAATPYTSPDSNAVYGTTGLSIVKTAAQAFFRAAGDTLDYSYTVTNTGAAVLSGPVTVADDRTPVTCPALTTVGDLDAFFDPGEVIVCSASYSVVAADVTARVVTNTASAAAGGAASPPASVSVPLAPDLSVAKSNDVGGAVALGGTFNWTLAATNAASAGSAAFSSGQVLLVDDLPIAGASYAAAPTATTTGGTSGTINCALAAGTVTCTAAGAVVLPPGGGFSLAIATTATAPGPLANPRSGGACSVDSGNVLPEISDANNACPPNAVTVLAAPLLAVDKVANAANFTAGGSGGYTLTVANTGAVASSGTITVTDVLPAGLSVANGPVAPTGANAADWSCTAASNTITCTSSVAIGAAGSSVFGFSVAVAADAPSSVTNPASLRGGGDPACTVATPCADPTPPTTPVLRATSLAISKSDGSTTYTPGGTATYALVVTNAGPSTAAAVNVTDTLPAGVTLSGTPTCIVTGTASCGTVSGAVGTGSFSASGATLAPGAGHSLSYLLPVAFAANLAADPLVNSAETSDSADPDSPHAATDSNARLAQTALTLSKDDGQAIYTPGGTATYLLTVGNSGPGDATGVSLADTLPAGVTLTAAPGCTATGGASCGSVTGAAGGSAFSVSGASLAAGAGNSLVYSLPVQFASGMTTNPLVNSASVNGPDLAAPVSASDSDTLLGVTGLTLAKTDGSPTYTPGGSAVYTLVLDNAGPSDANAVTVTDTLPAGVTLAGSPSCTAAGTAFCGSLSGSAGGSTVSVSGATLAAGAGNRLTYSLPVQFAADLLTSPLVNTATANDPAAPSPSTASDSDTRSALTDLVLAKTDGSANYTPGTTATYVLTLTNNGPSDATAVAIADTLPAGVTLSAPPSCTANGNAACGSVSGTAGGSSAGLAGATLGAQAGDSLVLSLPVSFAADLSVNPLINTATADDSADPDGAQAQDSDALAALSGLSLTKDDGAASYVPGGTATYLVVVRNAGPSNANALTLADPLPAGVTLTATPTCIAVGSAACGAITGGAGGTSFGVSGASLAAGPGNELRYSVPVAFAPDLLADPLANAVTVSDPTDPTPATATDSNVRAAQVALGVSKTDGSLSYTPGGGATYTVVVSNDGPSDALDTRVSDNLPPGVTLSGAPGCVAAGAANCGTVSGSAGGSAFSAVGARVPAGAGNTLTITLPVSFAPGLTTDPLVNTAAASDPGDADGAAASDSDVLLASAGLTLTKDDGAATYVPGGTATYVLTLTNAGPSNANAVSLTDNLPAGVTLTGVPACLPVGTATCGTITGSAGGGAFSVAGATLPAGPPNGLTYSLPVAYSAGLTADPLVNTAIATDPSDPTPAVGSDSNVRAGGSVVLQVTKTDGSAAYTPGGTATYVITVTNAGSGNAADVSVADTLPAGVVLTGLVSCTPSGSANCGTVTSTVGGGSFSASSASIAAGAGNQLQFSVPVQFAPDLTADPLVNTATASDPDAAGGANGSDSDTRGALADLSIVKTGPPTIAGGAPMSYTLLITNTGPSAADGAAYHDALPAGITGVTATCGSPTGGASCTAPAVTGSDIAGYVVDGTVSVLPPGGTVTVTIDGNAPAGPTQMLANTASVAPPNGTGDPTPNNNTSTATTTTPVQLQRFEID
ncbi:DUF11 domain-containing protein [Tahibacter harae]|uniref:DUF11 domain-containing protein n=1 Tax=Tahibacter harae TaxID=2963937 RepID=A0ABT1QM07_9GAMM|nr:DUF11 domain-containing protein [Tahibacter harae]MCQ4163558.1 DUF11 domain-containing protein [Tahibacter harae]